MKKYVIYDSTRKRILCDVEHVVDAVKIVNSLRLAEDDLNRYDILALEVNINKLFSLGGNENERNGSSDDYGNLLDLWDRERE